MCHSLYICLLPPFAGFLFIHTVLFTDRCWYLLHVHTYHQTTHPTTKPPPNLVLASLINLMFSSECVGVLTDELMNVSPLKIIEARDSGIKNEKLPFPLLHPALLNKLYSVMLYLLPFQAAKLQLSP